MSLKLNKPYSSHPYFKDWIHALKSPFRHTLKREFTVSGIGIHSGTICQITCRPLTQPRGYILNGIPLAHYRLTSSTFATQIQSLDCKSSVCIETPEHLLAALWAAGIDDVEIESSHSECPILDGSSWQWITCVQPCLTSSSVSSSPAGYPRTLFIPQNAMSWFFQESSLTWSPFSTRSNFLISSDSEFPFPHFHIDWSPDLPCLNREVIHSSVFTPAELLTRVIPARTFGWRSQETYLRDQGLIKGVSNDNCCIFEKDGTVHTPLRDPDEPALHKILDLIGDLTLIGQGRVSGRFDIKRGSHALNHTCIEEMRENSHLNSPFFLL